MKPGDIVRQYHHDGRHYDDAVVVRVYPWGGLDVRLNGVLYGWSLSTCKELRAKATSELMQRSKEVALARRLVERDEIEQERIRHSAPK